MLDTRLARNLPLPNGWPARLRSSVVHAVALAHFSLTFARGVAANSFNKRIRLQAEVDRLMQETALLREELRIKDARMLRIPAQRRPHYPPTERLAILELRAARGWSIAETARRLLVTPLTVASWMRRLDDEGPDALVRLPEPVSGFPEFVGYLVRRLKTLCPTMGSRKIAQVLCRAGLHLGATTVRRMLVTTDARCGGLANLNTDPLSTGARTSTGYPASGTSIRGFLSEAPCWPMQGFPCRRGGQSVFARPFSTPSRSPTSP